jgi:hypothetical protein
MPEVAAVVLVQLVTLPLVVLLVPVGMVHLHLYLARQSPMLAAVVAQEEMTLALLLLLVGQVAVVMLKRLELQRKMAVQI